MLTLSEAEDVADMLVDAAEANFDGTIVLASGGVVTVWVLDPFAYQVVVDDMACDCSVHAVVSTTAESDGFLDALDEAAA